MSQSNSETRFIRELAAGGCANAISSSLLNVFDVTKIKMQIQHTRQPIYSSTKHAITTIYTQEGLKGLVLPGLTATIIREISYSGLRFGLYTPVKQTFARIYFGDFTFENGHTPLFIKFASGMCTGIIGATITSPADLVKIRLQAESGVLKNGIFQTGLFKGLPPKYSSTFNAFTKIWSTEGGFKGIYRGVSATALRAAFVTGSQLSAYDHTKQTLKKHGVLEEGTMLHVFASIVSGLFTTTIAAPADILKTRMLGNSGNYKGLMDCFIRTVKEESFKALFKGWTSSYLRLAPHFIITLPLFEKFRLILGLKAL